MNFAHVLSFALLEVGVVVVSSFIFFLVDDSSYRLNWKHNDLLEASEIIKTSGLTFLDLWITDLTNLFKLLLKIISLKAGSTVHTVFCLHFADSNENAGINLSPRSETELDHLRGSFCGQFQFTFSLFRSTEFCSTLIFFYKTLQWSLKCWKTNVFNWEGGSSMSKMRFRCELNVLI